MLPVLKNFNTDLQTDESDMIIHCNNNNIDTRRVWFDIIEIIFEDLLVLCTVQHHTDLLNNYDNNVEDWRAVCGGPMSLIWYWSRILDWQTNESEKWNYNNDLWLSNLQIRYKTWYTNTACAYDTKLMVPMADLWVWFYNDIKDWWVCDSDMILNILIFWWYAIIVRY